MVRGLEWLAALFTLFVVRCSLGVLCVVLEFFICFMSQDRILACVDFYIVWHLCASERPCAAVAPSWSPMKSSRILASSSCNVLSEYIRHGPGMPYFM